MPFKDLFRRVLVIILIVLPACSAPTTSPTQSPLPFVARSTAIVTIGNSAITTGSSMAFTPTMTNSAALNGLALLSIEQPLNSDDHSSGTIYQIFQYRPATGSLTRLTNTTTDETEAAMSPDNNRIIFVSGRNHQSDRDLFLMKANGTDQQVFYASPGNGTNLSPQWSPDGTKIAWYSNQDGHFEIYVANSDKSHVQRLTNSNANSAAPSWSPDGNEIVFASDRSGNWEIYLMDNDGNNQRHIGGVESNFNWRPHFSPNGRTIVFSSEDQNTDIYTINKDGSNLRRLTDDGNDHIQANWVNDNQLIHVSRVKGGNLNPFIKWQLYLFDLNTMSNTLLLEGSQNIRDPFWAQIQK